MRLVTPPEPPITLEQAKAELRVDHDDHDALIQSYIEAATAYLDGPTGRYRQAIMPQVWEETFDAFPGSEIRLPFGPVLNVVSVGYVDAGGADQTVSADAYVVDAYRGPGWVVPVSAWPSTMATINAVTVRWTAGMGEVCPPDVQQAVRLMLHFYYDGTDVTAAINDLVQRRKRQIIA